MMLKVSELKKDILTLKSMLKNKTITEQEKDAIISTIEIYKRLIEDLEMSGESIIEAIY